VLHFLRVYVGQFESLAKRWVEERCDLLQPDLPSPHNIMQFIIVELIKDVGKKEVELVGMSSGAHAATGRLDFVYKGGTVPTDAQTTAT
jgi:hypothetical protein